jgi:hypothetical protein
LFPSNSKIKVLSWAFLLEEGKTKGEQEVWKVMTYTTKRTEKFVEGSGPGIRLEGLRETTKTSVRAGIWSEI